MTPARPGRDEAQEAAAMTLDLEALKRVAEAATPGPWEVSDTDVRTSAFVRAPRFGHVCNAPVPLADCYERETNQNSQARKNIAHIATFDPPTVLALIARCEAAEAKAAELGTYCREAADGFAGLVTVTAKYQDDEGAPLTARFARSIKDWIETCEFMQRATKGEPLWAEYQGHIEDARKTARAAGFRDGIEAAAAHLQTMFGDIGLVRTIRALPAAPEPQA